MHFILNFAKQERPVFLNVLPKEYSSDSNQMPLHQSFDEFHHATKYQFFPANGST
jgi:hypothetical protein